MVHDVTDSEASATEPAQVDATPAVVDRCADARFWAAPGPGHPAGQGAARGSRGRRTRDLLGRGSGSCPRRVRADLESTTVGRGVARRFDNYAHDKVLYREAHARGLDRDDPLVKMSLVRKITMLGTVAAENREPTDAELKAYFDLRGERYPHPGIV